MAKTKEKKNEQILHFQNVFKEYYFRKHFYGHAHKCKARHTKRKNSTFRFSLEW